VSDVNNSGDGERTETTLKEATHPSADIFRRVLICLSIKTNWL
jgi:hypothetical protein